MNALDKAYKELTQSKKQKQEIRLESNPVVIMHEFKNEVMRFLKQLASIALTHDYRTSITNFPKVQQVEVSKLPKEAFKVVNEIDTTKIEKMISEMKEMSKRDKQVLVKNQVDMSMVETLLESVVRAVEASKKTNDGSTTKDSKELLRAITELKDVMSKDKQMAVTIANFDSFPVALPIASYKNAAGETKQGLVDADNHVQVDVLSAPAVTIDTTGLATDTNQTNGSQKTQIVDAGGEAATVTGGKLDVNASIDTTGLATSANQTTIIGHVDGIEGLLTTIDADTGTIATEVAGLLTDAELRATPVPVSGTVTATATDLDIRNLTNTDVITAELSAVDNAVLDTIAAKDFATQTTLSAINAKLVTGTDIGDVTINNASGGSAVNIQDGGNTITVDGTVGVSGTVTADTELPTAVALADLSSNPTTTAVGSYLYAFDNGTGYNRLGLLNSGADGQSGGRGLTVGSMLFNGTSYDRERGDATNGTLVNLGSNNDVTVSNAAGASAVNIQDGGNTITVDYATTGSGTATGALRVELPTNGTGVIATVGAVTAITNALPAGTNAIGKLAANSGVDIGDVDVTSISAGSNLIGDVSLQPRTANGCTIFRSLDLDETEEEIKATAGNVYGYYFYNKAATAMYLKFYNATAANVTVGTTTPVLTMGLPAGAAGHVGLPYAPSFGTAITAAVTTGIADNDTGAPAANDVSINVFYK